MQQSVIADVAAVPQGGQTIEVPGWRWHRKKSTGAVSGVTKNCHGSLCTACVHCSITLCILIHLLLMYYCNRCQQSQGQPWNSTCQTECHPLTSLLTINSLPPFQTSNGQHFSCMKHRLDLSILLRYSHTQQCCSHRFSSYGQVHAETVLPICLPGRLVLSTRVRTSNGAVTCDPLNLSALSPPPGLIRDSMFQHWSLFGRLTVLEQVCMSLQA